MANRKAPLEEVRLTRPFVTTDNTALPSSSVQPLAESDGSLVISLRSKDAAGNLEAPLVDTADVLWVRHFDGWVQLDPVVVPSSEGVLLDGSASLTAGGVYEVAYRLVNIDGTNAVTVSVGVDIGAGASLGTFEYWARSVVVPAGGNSGWQFGGIIGADDDIRGVAGAADDAAINFRVRRVDVAA